MENNKVFWWLLLTRVVKTGVSIPKELVDKLDKIVAEMNIPSRSHA